MLARLAASLILLLAVGPRLDHKRGKASHDAVQPANDHWRHRRFRCVGAFGFGDAELFVQVIEHRPTERSLAGFDLGGIDHGAAFFSTQVTTVHALPALVSSVMRASAKVHGLKPGMVNVTVLR